MRVAWQRLTCSERWRNRAPFIRIREVGKEYGALQVWGPLWLMTMGYFSLLSEKLQTQTRQCS